MFSCGDSRCTMYHGVILRHPLTAVYEDTTRMITHSLHTNHIDNVESLIDIACIETNEFFYILLYTRVKVLSLARNKHIHMRVLDGNGMGKKRWAVESYWGQKEKSSNNNFIKSYSFHQKKKKQKKKKKTLSPIVKTEREHTHARAPTHNTLYCCSGKYINNTCTCI